MKKRLLSLLLCVALVLTFAPLCALAKNAVISEIVITNADIVPVEGESPADHVGYTLPRDRHYRVEMCSWWDETNGYWYASKALEFKKGDTYQLVWNFYANEGYEFAENTTVTINGSAANVGEARYLFEDRPDTFFVKTDPVTVGEESKQRITEIEINDADITPIFGEKVGDHLAYTLPADAPYAMAFNGWFDVFNGRVLADDDVFAANCVYCAFWNLVANEGYAFAKNATILVNGSADVADAEYSYLDVSGDEPLFIISAKGAFVEDPNNPAEPQPNETVVDLRIGDGEYYGVKGNDTLFVDSLDVVEDITVLTQNGVDIEGMSDDWSMSTKFLDSEGRGVLEVQVFEEGDDYITFNLQSHYADCPGAQVEDFQIMLITLMLSPATEPKPTETMPQPTETEITPTATEPNDVLLGDITADGVVNMKDVLMLREYLCGYVNFEKTENVWIAWDMHPEHPKQIVTVNETNADANMDGEINMKDVLAVRKYLAGLVDHLGA